MEMWMKTQAWEEEGRPGALRTVSLWELGCGAQLGPGPPGTLLVTSLPGFSGDRNPLLSPTAPPPRSPLPVCFSYEVTVSQRGHS